MANTLKADESLIMDPVITIRDLRMSFGDNHVLQGFNLTLRDQENLVLIGKSGSGKSVLLKCIIGLNTADSGELIVLGKKVAELSQEELNALRANVGFLFQGSALYDSMTVRENLEFPLRRHLDRVDPARIDDLILSTLESVGLAKAIDLMPAELSGGMKRRVALARTIILRPKIILYDEPTSGLDPITAKEIAQLILDIQDKYQTASLIITHDLDFARSISQHIVLLVDGVDYAMGSYDELSTSSDPSISAFFK